MPPCPSCTICDTMPIKPTIADTLKAAIESSGLPFLTLEQRTGVTRQSLMSFVKGERTLRHGRQAGQVLRAGITTGNRQGNNESRSEAEGEVTR